MDYTKPLTFIFDDKKWVKKLLPLFLVILPISIVSFLANIASYTPALLSEFSDVPYQAVAATSAGLGILVIIIALLSIPVGLYYFGYEIAVIENIKDGEKELPEHTELHDRLVTGLKIFGARFLYGLVLVLLGVIPVLGGFLTAFLFGQDLIAFGILSLVVTILLGIAWLVFILAFSALFIPLTNYQYIKTKSFRAMFDVQKIVSMAKKVWKELLVAAVYSIGIGFALGIVSLILFFIPIVKQPLIQLYTLLLRSHLYGQIFAILDKSK